MSGAAPLWDADASYEQVPLDDLALPRVPSHRMSDPAIWSGGRPRPAGLVSGRLR
jgi:hypothetical protein